jgi:hypothetical protein
MPTVKLPDGTTKTYPYNAVGKAQASQCAKMYNGKVKNNPGYGMEKKMSSSY